jgi:hypothetical protein
MNKRKQLKSDSLHKHVANMLADGYAIKSIVIETKQSFRHIINVVAKIKANPEMYFKLDNKT